VEFGFQRLTDSNKEEGCFGSINKPGIAIVCKLYIKSPRLQCRVKLLVEDVDYLRAIQRIIFATMRFSVLHTDAAVILFACH
jgi:hypothetical protein